jgi:hypothetical protein
MRLTIGLGGLVCGVVGVWAAGSLPDSDPNPQTTFTEMVDSTRAGEIIHIIDRGNGHPPEVITLSPSGPNAEPRMEIDAASNTWVVWERNGDLLLRRRSCPDLSCAGAWSTETVLDPSDHDSAASEIVHDGANPWVACEYSEESDTGIGILEIQEDPDPYTSNAYSKRIRDRILK